MENRKSFNKLRLTTISGNIDPVAIGEIMRKNKHQDFKITPRNKVLLVDWIDTQNRQKILFPLLDSMFAKDSSFTVELFNVGMEYESHLDYKILSWTSQATQRTGVGPAISSKKY